MRVRYGHHVEPSVSGRCSAVPAQHSILQALFVDATSSTSGPEVLRRCSVVLS
jgi:hypothetical protein